MAIRGTYCDLGIRLEEKLVELIEAKAIGIELNDRHLKQVVDYAATVAIQTSSETISISPTAALPAEIQT